MLLEPQAVARRLESIRERTLSLVACVEGEDLKRQVVPILSPMVWDLGHIGHFEELWLNRELGGHPPLVEDMDAFFDAIANPRPTRSSLPIPTGQTLWRYLAQVRERTLQILLQASEEPARAAQWFEMVAQHEEQHQETLLQAMQILDEPPYAPAQRRALPRGREVADTMVTIPAGPFSMGSDGRGFCYDNELGQHTAECGPFSIDRFPVGHDAFRHFVDEGGYSRDEFWSDAGLAWRRETGAQAPANWLKEGDEWRVRFMDQTFEWPGAKPVVHVSYHEADAYSRYVGKRLPTEAEWEKAALWDPARERARRFPWGDDPPSQAIANLDQLAFEPADCGAYPSGASAYGVEQMIGDVWEWTASDFAPYPGFRSDPYPEYSEIHFGSEYKVLRGGSWATRAAVARGTFRNWDLPIRRQIFAGFRCAQSG